ncbi:hypothetical protein K402DRAFT_467455 [Aulographum hederae CBS 113979]|uniref:Mediator of RNA polymerase II transcription subunit 13 n=1 Tax=Aulographum hederae CBS 113979 TaxID=1176131 RepID=A0A6G1GKS6_9PEZI|nr:hypothetical protein K402DRAFT_467455 [Aulographum hederae CBS 113979]
MDFLRSCQTGVQVITGFGTTPLIVYSVSKPSPSEHEERSSTYNVELNELEIVLREKKSLATVDNAKRIVCIFRRPEQNEEAINLPRIVEGTAAGTLQMTVLQQGTLQASDLPTIRSKSNVPTGSSPFPTSPASSDYRASQEINNAGMPEGQVELSGHDQLSLPVIYSYFISAVVSSLSYQLCITKFMVPLNSRTLLFNSSDMNPSPEASQFLDTVDNDWKLLTLDAHLTSMGTLIISSEPSVTSTFRQIGDTKPTLTLRQRSTPFLLSPAGIVAKLAEDSSAKSQENHTSSPGPVMVPVSSSFNVPQWQSLVKRWLNSKGTFLRKDSAWVSVGLVAHANASFYKDSVGTVLNNQPFLWPTELCFYLDRSASKFRSTMMPPGAEDEGRARLDSIFRSETGSYIDPLIAAHNWMTGENERAKAVEDRNREAHLAETQEMTETDAVMASASDSLPAYPSSPLYSRNGAYGDLQNMNSVYPTPPDGVLTQTAGTSGQDAPTVDSTATAPNVLADGQNDGMDIDSSAEHPPLVQQNSNDDSNNDLFEDMDEDVFEGNDITEDDFNFFDEPDDLDEDFDVVDAEFDAQEEAKLDTDTPQDSVSASHDQVPENPGQVLDGADMKLKSSPHVKPAVLVPSTPNSVRHGISSQTMDAANEFVPMEPKASPDPQHISKSPVDLTTTKQRLVPSPKRVHFDSNVQEKATPVKRRSSVYDPISFSESLKMVDSKYAADGVFAANSVQRVEATAEKPSLPPQSRRSSKAENKASEVPSKLAGTELIKDPKAWLASGRSYHELDGADLAKLAFSPSVDTKPISEPLAFVPPPVTPSTPSISRKRKWDMVDQEEAAVSEAFADRPATTTTLGSEAYEVIHHLEPHLVNSPLISSQFLDNAYREKRSQSTTITASPAKSPSAQSPSYDPNRDVMEIAQMIVDQFVSGTLDILNENECFEVSDILTVCPRANHAVHDMAKEAFGKTARCEIIRYALIQDSQPNPSQSEKPPTRTLPKKMLDSIAVPGHLIFPIAPPHVRIRRSETPWAILPPALSYWEPLGLGPASGLKNVMAYCIFPDNEDLRSSVSIFLAAIGTAYESCRLGSHIHGDNIEDCHNGLVPFPTNNEDDEDSNVFIRLRRTCMHLGHLLSKVAASLQEEIEDDNLDESSNIVSFVIYMVDFFDEPSAMRELCSSFWAMFQSYQVPSWTSKPSAITKPDIVLQIIPMKYIASVYAPVIPDPSQALELAREIYDRCPPAPSPEERSSLSIPSATAIQLEEFLPRSVPFKLVADPPPDLLHEVDSHLHLGYATSTDGEWLVVAWTDNVGKYQATVPYSLRGSRSFAQVALEIWQATLGIMQARRVSWRLCISKTGIMSRMEQDIWITVASSRSLLTVTTTLMSVDISPRLSLRYGQFISPTGQTTSSQTPVTTPQNQGVSPDAHGGLTPAATPSEIAQDLGVNDPDAHLVDITDETCGVVLSHRRNVSKRLGVWETALASGLLVKRGREGPPKLTTSSADGDAIGPIAVGFDILWIGQSSRTAEAGAAAPLRSTAPENMLREYLSLYRGLGLLAKLRGMRGCRGGTIPWHVVAAMRGVKGLEACMELT